MSLEVNIEKKLDGFTLRAAFTAGNTSTALLGASGCGKSMTLRCIAGIVKPDRGRIVLDGRVLFDSAQHIDLPPQQRGVGLLFQNYALFPNMTVEQNIRCGLKAEGRGKGSRKRAPVSGLRQAAPTSGGQRDGRFRGRVERAARRSGAGGRRWLRRPWRARHGRPASRASPLAYRFRRAWSGRLAVARRALAATS